SILTEQIAQRSTRLSLTLSRSSSPPRLLSLEPRVIDRFRYHSRAAMNVYRVTRRSHLDMSNEVQAIILKLLAYCRTNDWAGYDPYDALNSRLFEALPFLDSRFPRLVLTQALKRSPVNFRRLLLIPKAENPKAIGLFLSALLKLSALDLPDHENLISLMVDRLIALRSPGVSSWCWGYSFPWQGRTTVVPKGEANLVSTTFAANALLDYYEQRQASQCLNMAISAAEYMLNELYWDDCSSAGFSYPAPSIRVQVHSAPRYFHNRTYPIDIHCVAQSIITLLTFRDLDPRNAELADSVFRWAMNHMWDDRGFFYYRVLRCCTIRTSYMRWSQAWMLLA